MNHMISRLSLLVPAALAATGLILSASPLAAAPARIAEAKGQTDIDRAVAALHAITTMQADFAQVDTRGNRVTGQLTFRNPGRIRFQYQPDVPMLIVADGDAMTMVDYEVKKVRRWPIKHSPLGVLLDPSRDVARFSRLVPSGDPDRMVIEVKDRERPEYGAITLHFQRNASAPGGLALVGWSALDAQNRHTTVTLANHRYGIPVADSAFAYSDPKTGAQGSPSGKSRP